MKLLNTTVLALAAAILASPVTGKSTSATEAQPSAATPSPIKLSKKASKAIVALQKAVAANDFAAVPGLTEAAKAVAETAEDKYAIGILARRAATASKNREAEVAATEYLAAANYLKPAQVAGLFNMLGVAYYNDKDKARAVQLFQRALQVDPNNAEAQRLLAESQLSGDPKAALASMKKAMEAAAAQGEKVPEDTFKRAIKAAYDARSPDAVSFGRAWIASYPSSESWNNGIAIYRNMMQPDVTGTLDLLRLLRATGYLNAPSDYTLYATAASEQGNFGEAQSVIDQGLAEKKVDPSAKLVREIVNGLKDKPKPTLADLETAAAAAKSGSAMMAVGNRFYGLGNYARAADMYRKAIASGGDVNLGNLHLGMALARAGDKAGAQAALKSVAGEFAAIASYWMIYAGG